MRAVSWGNGLTLEQSEENERLIGAGRMHPSTYEPCGCALDLEGWELGVLAECYGVDVDALLADAYAEVGRKVRGKELMRRRRAKKPQRNRKNRGTAV